VSIRGHRGSRAVLATSLLLPLVLTACDDGLKQLPQGNASQAIIEAEGGAPLATADVSQAGATPMRDRVAVIGLLNKRNGETRDLGLKPGEALRVGDVIVRLRACETTAPWENSKETGAFVQLDVRARQSEKMDRVFSGWLFKERPDRNIVQHPIYDIWVKSCDMSWPDTGPDTIKAGDKSEAKARSASVPGPADNAVASSVSETSPSATESSD